MAVGKGSIKRAVKANSTGQKSEMDTSKMELEQYVNDTIKVKDIPLTEGDIIANSIIELRKDEIQESYTKIGKELPIYLL